MQQEGRKAWKMLFSHVDVIVIRAAENYTPDLQSDSRRSRAVYQVEWLTDLKGKGRRK